MTLAPTAGTTVAAVIGHPVRHSRSPAIHNAGFAAAGLDWAFMAFDVAAGRGRAAVEAMRTLGLGGLSVTMPLKDEVAAAADGLAPAASALGAVNCLAWEGERLVGHNTDGDGFVASLRAVDVDPAAHSVAVVGGGGAARAVVDALRRAGSEKIVVVNRSADKAAAAAALAGDVGSVGSIEAIAEVSLVVNATSVGMDGTVSAGELPFETEILRSSQVVVDLVYAPRETRLLALADAVGCTTVGGLGMLVHQAAAAFELWTGVSAPIDTMWAAAADMS